ncbi:MAG: hypothetical protein V3S55_06520 [Nitrospiraceae bacterium]
MSEERRCQKQVWRGSGLGDWNKAASLAGHSQCRRRGKVEERGKWWCSIHAPSAEAARLAKRAEKALPPTFLTEGYDKGFAEGVDWATPRIWNEAIEAAAVIAGALGKDYDAKLEVGPNIVAAAPLQEGGSIASHALSAAIRKLKKP